MSMLRFGNGWLCKFHFKILLVALFAAQFCVPFLLCSASDDADKKKNGDTLVSAIKARASSLNNAADLDKLVNAVSGKKLVLLGEASHGTHEYYLWRDKISRRLISEKGFNFIAVEGDFASLYELNRYVKNLPGAAGSAREVLARLDRWPVWMWGNQEVLDLAEWLRKHNDGLEDSRKIGFYGMDVYDEWRSKEALLEFLEEHNEDKYLKIKEYYECIKPFAGDSWAYARAVGAGRADCAGRLKAAVEAIRDARQKFEGLSDHEFLYALQNAYVLKNAEKFYRKSVTRRDASSWNARAVHMHETVCRLLDVYGESAKGIVWAHNTHIGDARHTSMRDFGQVNIGQLTREKFGMDNVFLVGFTTYSGRVQAGAQWGAARQEMEVVKAQSGSLEYLLYNTGLESFYLLFDDTDRSDSRFMSRIGHRAIGVVYNPRNDFRQYVPSVVPMRYDAMVFFRETKALNPLAR